MATILTPSAVMEVKRLYALLDERGRRQYSMMEIAEMLGVGETTVYRAVKKRGAYMAVRDLPTDTEAAESAKRFTATLAGGTVPAAPEKPPLENVSQSTRERANFFLED